MQSNSFDLKLEILLILICKTENKIWCHVWITEAIVFKV